MTKVYNRATEKELRQQLRRNMPKAEIVLWSRLRNRQVLGYKFRRQFSVGAYAIDFYCPELKLAIEVDGDSHFNPNAMENDRVRLSFIESFGICFVRVTNNQIYHSIDDVMEYITQIIMQKTTPPRPSPCQGEGEFSPS
ncbi:MAG: endonuclease domain-containing protein [Chloroflexi bacterium]|nr:endonuclease domain-containing protein [Chloroflexota bacterium]